ncbi:MAG: hypothetical protein JW969_08910 [Spirochaetales bacterium]|nr:hypothetical protein [Spirochaetales bacterium]
MHPPAEKTQIDNGDDGASKDTVTGSFFQGKVSREAEQGDQDEKIQKGKDVITRLGCCGTRYLVSGLEFRPRYPVYGRQHR